MKRRSSRMSRIRALKVAGMDYQECLALQNRHLAHKAATGEDLPEYVAKLEEMERICREAGKPITGSLVLLHDVIAGGFLF